MKQFKFFPRVFLTVLLFPACAHTAPKSPTPPPKTWRIAVVSDMNQSYGSKQYTAALKAAVQHIRQNGTSLVLSTGDMVAGQKSGLDYRGMWNAFHLETTRPFAQSGIPFLPSPGNHDASASAGFAKERGFYQSSWAEFPLDRFNAQRAAEDQVHFLPGVAQNFPFNYAVTMGPAIFIALDATMGGNLVNQQIDWLEEVLRKSEPYAVKMVFGHFPIFPFTFERANDYLGNASPSLSAKLEAMLENYQVDFFLSGHHHGYFPGRRLGNVRYVSIPLLGTGARYLLTADRTQKSRSPQGFVYLEFDAAGNIAMQTLASPAMTEVPTTSLPEAISLPRRDATDCKRCAAFPNSLFIDSQRRILYHRF